MRVVSMMAFEVAGGGGGGRRRRSRDKILLLPSSSSSSSSHPNSFFLENTIFLMLAKGNLCLGGELLPLTPGEGEDT